MSGTGTNSRFEQTVARPVAAVLSALQLAEPCTAPALSLTRKEWEQALAFADRGGLTLHLAEALAGTLPDWAQPRTAKNLLDNRERNARLADLHREVAIRLAQANAQFAVLKGLTHGALSGLSPERRVQYDLDLWTPRGAAQQAVAALLPLGFESFQAMQGFPTDHLPPLIRRTGWQFRGDYFDPDIPTAIEVHYRLWSERDELLSAPGTDDFWQRRTQRIVAGAAMPQLAPVDALGFASLHLARHLLRGSVRPFHVYELAHMLHRQVRDHCFWRDWRELHAPQLRRLEVAGFLLAAKWFGCRLPEAVEEERYRLPSAARLWFDHFALSPLAQSNKSELWLHWSLLESSRDCWAVARSRLLPVRLPPPIDAVYLPRSAMTARRRALRAWRQCRYVAGRCRHHLLAALRFAGSSAHWWWKLRAARG